MPLASRPRTHVVKWDEGLQIRFVAPTDRPIIDQAKNLLFRIDGTVVGRPRFAQDSYSGTKIASFWKGSLSSQTLLAWINPGFDTVTVQVEGGSSATLAAGSPTKSLDYTLAVAPAQGRLHVSGRRGSGGVHQYVSLSGTTPSFTDIASAPRAAHLLWKDSILFAANTADRPSGLYFSNLLDPLTWDAADYIEFDPDDNDEITGLATFGDDLVVFKRYSVHIMSGKTRDNFARYRLTDRFGAVGPNAILPYVGGLAFYDERNGLVLFDGSGFRRLDKKLGAELLRDAPQAHEAALASFVWDDEYLGLSLIDRTAGHRIWCLQPDKEAWSVWDGGFYDAQRIGDDTLFSSILASGVSHSVTQDGINTLASGATDTAELSLSWITAAMAEKLRLRRIELHGGDPSVNALLTLQLYRDYDDTVWTTFTWPNYDASDPPSMERFAAFDVDSRVDAWRCRITQRADSFRLSQLLWRAISRSMERET